MDWVDLVLTVTGTGAGVVGAYFAYIPVREKVRRRWAASPAPAPPAPAPDPPAPVPGGAYEVFVSYAREDTPAAEALATRLRREELTVFLALWLEPGVISVLETERAILGSASGLLVCSRTTLNDRAIKEEYAALVQRAHSDGRRFIPVLIENIDRDELPVFARIREPVRLFCPGAPEYEEGIARLMRALRPRRPAPGSG